MVTMLLSCIWTLACGLFNSTRSGLVMLCAAALAVNSYERDFVGETSEPRLLHGNLGALDHELAEFPREAGPPYRRHVVGRDDHEQHCGDAGRHAEAEPAHVAAVPQRHPKIGRARSRPRSRRKRSRARDAGGIGGAQAFVLGLRPNSGRGPPDFSGSGGCLSPANMALAGPRWGTPGRRR